MGGGLWIALQEAEHQGTFQQKVKVAGQVLRLSDAELAALPLQQLPVAGLEDLRRQARPLAGLGVLAGLLDEQAAVERGRAHSVGQPVEHRQDPVMAAAVCRCQAVGEAGGDFARQALKHGGDELFLRAELLVQGHLGDAAD